MSSIQQNTTTSTTQFNDGTQLKTTEFTKKSNLVTENTDLSKPEFEYNRPAPTTLHTSGATTGGSSIAGSEQFGSTQPSGFSTTTVSHQQQPTGPSTTDSIKQKFSNLGHQINEAVTNASQHINDSINQHSSKNTTTTAHTNTANQQYNTVTPASEGISNTQLHQEHQQTQGGLGSKLSDMMAHVGAALHHGHPVHAVTNATTAAKIGEAERQKHQRGPLMDEAAGTTHSSSLDNPNFNAAGQPYDNQSSAALYHPTNTSSLHQQPMTTTTSSTLNQPTTSTFNQSTTAGTSDLSSHNTYGSSGSMGHSNYTTGDKMRDMASHASSQLSHGNPLHAIADAPAAARIGEAEKLKHEKGPIDDSNLSSNQSSTMSHNIPSGSAGTGSLGGVTGMSGQSGAASISHNNQFGQSNLGNNY
jgi:hypothetical protein